jgi:hypothetical protein
VLDQLSGNRADARMQRAFAQDLCSRHGNTADERMLAVLCTCLQHRTPDCQLLQSQPRPHAHAELCVASNLYLGQPQLLSQQRQVCIQLGRVPAQQVGEGAADASHLCRASSQQPTHCTKPAKAAAAAAAVALILARHYRCQITVLQAAATTTAQTTTT